jgi:hypothetical protein
MNPVSKTELQPVTSTCKDFILDSVYGGFIIIIGFRIGEACKFEILNSNWG